MNMYLTVFPNWSWHAFIRKNFNHLWIGRKQKIKITYILYNILLYYIQEK